MGYCSTTAPTRGMPSRVWTHPIGVVVALGIHNPIDVGLQIGLVDRNEAVNLQAIMAAMLFRGVIVQASTGIIDAVMTAQAACTGLVSPFCATPLTRTFSRAASGHGITGLTKHASTGQA